MKEKIFNQVTQVSLPTFTILGFLFISLKKPEFGLVFNLIAQIFWLYSSWKAWRKAGQIGIFVTTIVLTCIVLYGIVNYWIL